MKGVFTIYCFVCNREVGVAIEPSGSEREQRNKALDIHYALCHPENDKKVDKDENSSS